MIVTDAGAQAPPAAQRVRTSLAEIYRTAALSGLGMRTVSDYLETIRERIEGRATWTAVWDAFSAAIIGSFDEKRFVAMLQTSRDSLMDQLLEDMVASVVAMPAGESEGAWVALVAELIAALRPDLVENVCALPMTPKADASFNNEALSVARLLDAARFAETRGFIARLLDDDRVPPSTRARLHVVLGLILLHRRDNRRGAEAQLAAARDLVSGDVEVDLFEVDIILERADWANFPEEKQALLDEADRLLEPLLAVASQAVPPIPEVYIRAGDLAVQRSRLAAGDGTVPDDGSIEELYRRAQREAPWSAEAHRAVLGWLARDPSPNEIEIARLIDMTHLLEPSDRGDVHCTVAARYIEAGRVDLGEAALRNARAEEPEHLDATLALALVLHARDARQEAEQLMDEAHELAPNNYDVWQSRALLLSNESRWDEALAAWAEAARCEPDMQMAVLAATASLHEQRGDLEQARLDAVAACRLAIERGEIGGAPALAAATVLSSLVFSPTSELPDDQALRMLGLQREVHDDAYEPQYRNVLGNYYYRAGRYAEAATEYEQAIAMSPADGVVNRNLAHTLRMLGRWDEARSRYETAAYLDPTYEHLATDVGRLENLRGNALFDASDVAAAIDAYRSALQHLPNDVVIIQNLAVALETEPPSGHVAERLREAADWIARAHEVDPTGGYDVRAHALRTVADGVEWFGEPFSVPTSAVDRCAVWVGTEVATVVGEAGQLRAEVSGPLSDLGRRLDAMLGISLPAVQFRLDSGHPPGLMTLHVAGTTVDSVTEPAVDEVANWLTRSLIDHCPEAIGPDLVASRLDLEGAGGDLAGLTRAIRAMVSELRCIEDADTLVSAYTAAVARGDGAVAAAEAIVPLTPAKLSRTGMPYGPPVALPADVEEWFRQATAPTGDALEVSEAASATMEPVVAAIRQAVDTGAALLVEDPVIRPAVAALLRYLGIHLPVEVASCKDAG